MGGSILEKSLLDVNLANENERGMLGIAVANNTQNGKAHTYVFVYFTESKSSKIADDGCPSPEPNNCKHESERLRNRLYKYELVNNELLNPKLLLDLPASPGPSHNGGVVLLGPDDNIYTVIGDLIQRNKTLAQNREDSEDPDGRGGILRITQDGYTVGKGILGDTHPLNKYYAYGIRNSFGLDFDPLTGNLWDTENGEDYGDEINLVKPGFNSGWSKVQGIWSARKLDLAQEKPDDLVEFNGKGDYSPPELTWKEAVAPTALKFMPTDKLKKEYKGDLFVGDHNNGYIYHFDLNKDRTELVLTGKLSNRVADTNAENDEANIIFGTGFGSITDIQVGPYDGYLYGVSFMEGKIYRIVPVHD
jgi:aldose sugar dehydrogenase